MFATSKELEPKFHAFHCQIMPARIFQRRGGQVLSCCQWSCLLAHNIIQFHAN